MNKKGFTLIELLAVIVILAVIALIATPVILNVIENSKKGAFKDSVLSAYNSLELYMFKNGIEKLDESGIEVKKLDLKSDFNGGKFVKKDGKIKAYFIKNNEYCANGNIENIRVETVKNCYKIDDTNAELDEEKYIVLVTSKTIEVVLLDGIAKDAESGIKEYQITINGETKIKKDVGEFIFDDLKSGNQYEIKIKIINGNNMESLIITNAITKTIDEPEFTVLPEGWSISKTVEINYNDPNNLYIHQYSTDEGKTWKEYKEKLTIKENVSFIARNFDGKNSTPTSSDYKITGIDTEKPEKPIITISDLKASGEWHNSDYKITLSGGKNISGNIYYWGLTDDPKNEGNEISSGESININSGTTSGNEYYFKICSGAGLCSDISSYVAKLDKTKPTAPARTSTSSNSNSITAVYNSGSAGVSKIKSIKCYLTNSSGTVTSNGTLSGNNCVFSNLTSNTTYYYKKCITNGVGLTACSGVSSILTAGKVTNFDYSGGTKSYTAICNGSYKLEVWGAQGGPNNVGVAGGKGGYATGYKKLNKDNVLYVDVGQIGNNQGLAAHNGGGRGNGGTWDGGNPGYAGGGGGATHIATTNRGILYYYSSYKSEVIIVAGGGGGTSEYGNAGGTGGGTSGGAGNGNSAYKGFGGTQTSGGAAPSSSQFSDPKGVFGFGGDAEILVAWNYTRSYAGGGGAGYYGGSGGTWSSTGSSLSYSGGGGGGSGYVGGVTSGSMTNGVRAGNGYARITINSCTN